MLETIFIVLQVIGIISFIIGLWFNFHLRQSPLPSVEAIRVFFHDAQKQAGESEVLNAALVVAAVISLLQHDYHMFAAAMGFTVVVGALMMLNNKCLEIKDNVTSKFSGAQA